MPRIAAALVSSALALSCGTSAKPPEVTTASTGAKAPAPAPVPQPVAHEPEHAVYSLVDNRLSAHLSRGGGLLIAAGSAGFAKYVRVGNTMSKGAKRSWELRVAHDRIKTARLVGSSGTIFAPLTAAQAAHPFIALRAFAGRAGDLAVRINHHPPQHADMAADDQTIVLLVPDGQLVAGENAIELSAPGLGLELGWMQLGGKAAPTDDGAVAFHDAATHALTIPKDGAMTWFVMIPEHARLRGDATCAIDVRVTAEDGATATGTLAAIDLAAVAGKAARLELANGACAQAAITNAALAVPGDAPAPPAHVAPPKHVVFVVMDSLRADRVRAFQPDARPETPTWDQLASTSTRFLADYSPGNESQVSHASMWSSNYLIKHRALDGKHTLAAAWTTIDEVAKRAGLFTAGVSANGYIRPARGFGTAWDAYVNHLEKGLGLKGKDVLAHGLSFIEPKKDQPWFLYLGFIDTHVTWRAKQPWLGRYDAGYRGRFATEFGDDGPGGMPQGLSAAEKDHVRALYDSNVSYQDDLLRQLIERLQQWGVWDDTMLIVTADHGDEQWEDGRIGHGGSVRETLVHVPLLIHYPALFPARAITAGTEGLDIVPTLAETLGAAADPEWQGMSLVGLANGGDAYPLLATTSKYENGHAGRIGHWKIQLAGPDAPRLYDLAKDPGERHDVWGDASAAIGARLLLDPIWILRQWNLEWKKAAWGNAADVSARFAADLGE